MMAISVSRELRGMRVVVRLRTWVRRWRARERGGGCRNERRTDWSGLYHVVILRVETVDEIRGNEEILALRPFVGGSWAGIKPSAVGDV